MGQFRYLTWLNPKSWVHKRVCGSAKVEDYAGMPLRMWLC